MLNVPVIGVAFPNWSRERVHRRATTALSARAESITNAHCNNFYRW